MDETLRHPWLAQASRGSDPNLHILVIESNSADMERLTHALESSGHRALPAPSLHTALSLAQFAQVGAVILDPAEGGDRLDFSVLDSLCRAPNTASAPKIIVSREMTTDERIEALRRGADDIVHKPWHEEELLLRVERRLWASQAPRHPAVGPALRHALTLGALPSEVMIDRYSVDEVIGQGAMGVVLRGEDPRLHRPVAVKVLGRSTIKPEHWADVAEMEHEGAALARFDHPHITKVFDAGLVDGLPYLVMELVEGESLSSRLQDGPLTPRAAVEMAEAVANALTEAHELGWVHRDIKPANILLGSDGSIKVSDFGLAGLAADGQNGVQVFGTPGYAPPECLLGEAHSPAGDLFSLGSVLYYALTGRPAFGGDSIAERLATTLTSRYVHLEQLVPDLPRPLYQLVTGLLDPLPSARPATAKLVSRRLEWLREALSYQALPNEDMDSAETVPVGTGELIN